MAPWIRKIERNLHVAVAQQLAEAFVSPHAVMIAKCGLSVRVPVERSTQLQLRTTRQRRHIRISDITAADDCNVHGIHRREPRAKWLSTFFMAQARQSISSSGPRKI